MLPAGRQIGPYTIQNLLGAGGMGEVYRARDTKLGRDVALKILPTQFTANADRRARFEREAPIARIAEPSTHRGHLRLRGRRQRTGPGARVGRGRHVGRSHAPGPVASRGGTGRRATDRRRARRRARTGIIHRDLKPSNIKITPDGLVKVLDFGLAKALAAAEGSGPDLPPSPTVTADGTTGGVILGTAAYMSPEQARVKPVDKRADIWAFGCVLYEMLTGSPRLRANTVTDTIATVIAAEPRGRRCRPIRRAASGDLLRVASRRMPGGGCMTSQTRGSSSKTRWPRLTNRLQSRRRDSGHAWLSWRCRSGLRQPLFFLWMARDRFGRPAEPSPPDTRVMRLTDLPGLEESPAFSPDGRSVAFTAGVGGKRQLFVQLIAGGAPLQITRDPVDHEGPRWSPDSSSIFIFHRRYQEPSRGASGRSRRLAASHGASSTAWEVPTSARRMGGLRFSGWRRKRIQLVTAPTDGSRFDVVAEFAPATYYLYPRWSPDGRWIAFQRGDSIRFDVFVVPATGGEPRQLTRENNMISGFAWLPDSTGIVYSSSRGGTMPYLPMLGLWQVTLRDGSVRRVTSGETLYVSPDISKSGAILVSRMKLQTDIWKFPVDGLPADNVRRGVRVTRQTGQVLTPTASPGDKEVAFLFDSGGHANLWDREHREWRAAPDHSRARSERGPGRPGVVARWPAPSLSSPRAATRG